MSLYNMMFGVNTNSADVLKALGLTSGDVPRFRDAYVSEEQLCVHTRTGGGNRDYYESLEVCMDNYPEYFEGDDKPNEPTGPWNEDLRSHPWFIRDEDDGFDSTYATFYFQPPKEIVENINADPSLTPAEKWQLLFESLKT